MTLPTFWKDQVKGVAVSLALELPLIAGLLKIIKWAGQDAILRIVSWTIVFMCVSSLLRSSATC
jgi:STE24 endopeptidase